VRNFYALPGRAKLSTTSREGKTLMIRIAEPGEILGLHAVTGGRYELTVETMQPGQAGGTFSRAAGVSWIRPGIVGCTAFGSKAETVLDFDSSPRLQQAATSDACKSLMCRSSVR